MFVFPKAIVYANLIPLIALIFLLVMIHYNPTHSKSQTKFFQVTAVLNIIMLIVVSLDYLFSSATFSDYYMWRKIISAIKFSCSPCIPILLYKVFQPGQSKKIFYVPVIVNAIVCVISIFNGIVFFIDETNDYYRGDLFILPFLVTVFYLLTIVFQRNYRYRHNKQVERLFLCASVAFLCTGMFLEIVYTYNFLTWDISAICFFGYYLLLCIHNAILDPLTGAFNRLHYWKRLSSYENTKKFTIAMIDLNNFKDINDTYGHDAGDKVLIYIVSILEKHITSLGTIYRIGGDEFIVITHKIKKAQLQTILEDVKKEVNEHKLDFAYGIDEYHIQEKISDVIERADKKMYEQKKRSKVS